MSNVGCRQLLAITSCLLVAAGCVGPPSAYLKAADDYAKATSASTTALQGATDSNHQLCEQRAQVDYLQHRLERSNYVDGKPLYWRDWYAKSRTRNADGSPGETLEQQCTSLQVADAVVDKCLAALSAYADALATISEADYSGKDVGAVATDVSTLLTKIPSVSASAANVVKALGGDTGPVATLTLTLRQAYTAKEVAKVVTAADPSVQKILGVLTSYLTAVGQEETLWEDETRTALNSIDQLLAERSLAPERQPETPAQVPSEKPAPATRKGRVADEKKEAPIVARPVAPAPEAAARAGTGDPLDVLTFYQVAQRWTEGMAKRRAALAALGDALQKLAQADQALMKANGDSKSPDLKTVLGLITQITTDIAAVQNALQGGSGQ